MANLNGNLDNFLWSSSRPEGNFQPLFFSRVGCPVLRPEKAAAID